MEGYGSPVGAKNVYACGACGKRLCTVHVDAGVTPFMLRCRRTPGCPGYAQSGMYRPTDLTPLAEWYRTAADDPQMTDPDTGEAVRDHVSKGGLLIRDITPNQGEA